MSDIGFFKKKKKEEEAEGSDSEEDSDSDGAGSGSSGSDGGSGGIDAAAVGGLIADITKIKATLESFKEIRKANSERFATINEQMGEIRGQVMDVNRNMGVIEVKTAKAADLVESVHPDKLMIQVQKIEGKVEGQRGLIESKDAMIQNIMEQLKNMRNQMKVFKGIEEVLKVNEEIKTEGMNIKKLTAIVERHADRVENVYVESQKTFKDFNDLIGQMQMVKGQLKEVNDKIGKLEVKSAKYVDKKEFEKRSSDLEKLGKRMKDIADASEKRLKNLDKEFGELKGSLKGTFDERLQRADLLSNAFTKVLQDNPMFAKGLNLGKYLEMEISGEASQATGGSAVGADKEGDVDSGAEDGAEDAAGDAESGEEKPAE